MILACLHLAAILPESFPTYQRFTLCWIFDIDEQPVSALCFFPNQRLIQQNQPDPRWSILSAGGMYQKTMSSRPVRRILNHAILLQG
jgi:hypothetical protein